MVFGSGCGSDGGKSEVTLDTTQQASVVASSEELVAAGANLDELKTNPAAEQSFAGLGQIFGNASQLWATKMQATAGGGAATSPYGLAYAALETGYYGATEGCYSQSGDSVTYDCDDAG